MSLSIFKVSHWKWSYFQIWYQRLNSWGPNGSFDTHIDLLTLCHLSSVIHTISHKWQMTDMDDRWQMPADISDNVNMGVYGTVWTSGIQPLIPNLKITSFSMINFENTQTHIFPLYVFGFLCIFWSS